MSTESGYALPNPTNGGTTTQNPTPRDHADSKALTSPQLDPALRLTSLTSRYGWLFNLKPRRLADVIARLLDLNACRSIVNLADGKRLYLDPFSDLGRWLLRDGTYEPDTAAVFAQEIAPGDTVIDVGANEGYFSVVAGLIVGPAGKVISVEPQARLRDIIEINMRLNGVTWHSLVPKAVGGKSGEQRKLHLYSRFNTGMSSIVRKYHSSIATEVIEFISFDDLLRTTGTAKVHFLKVDVEGFEDEVVISLLPMLRSGHIAKLYLDYHARLLTERGLNPAEINSAILDSGMQIKRRESVDFTGYVLYESNKKRGTT